MRSIRRRLQEAQRGRGEGGFQTIVGVVVAVVVIYLVFKILPLYMHENEMRDIVREQAAFGGAKGNDKIVFAIYSKAQELKLEVPMETIKVTRDGNKIVIELSYTEIAKLAGGKEFKKEVSIREESNVF